MDQSTINLQKNQTPKVNKPYAVKYVCKIIPLSTVLCDSKKTV